MNEKELWTCKLDVADSWATLIRLVTSNCLCFVVVSIQCLHGFSLSLSFTHFTLLSAPFSFTTIHRHSPHQRSMSVSLFVHISKCQQSFCLSRTQSTIHSQPQHNERKVNLLGWKIIKYYYSIIPKWTQNETRKCQQPTQQQNRTTLVSAVCERSLVSEKDWHLMKKGGNGGNNSKMRMFHLLFLS